MFESKNYLRFVISLKVELNMADLLPEEPCASKAWGIFHDSGSCAGC